MGMPAGVMKDVGYGTLGFAAAKFIPPKLTFLPPTLQSGWGKVGTQAALGIVLMRFGKRFLPGGSAKAIGTGCLIAAAIDAVGILGGAQYFSGMDGMDGLADLSADDLEALAAIEGGELAALEAPDQYVGDTDPEDEYALTGDFDDDDFDDDF